MMAIHNIYYTFKSTLYNWICLPSHRRKSPLQPVLEVQATSPPWPPQQILSKRVEYMAQVRSRSPRAIKDTGQDTPLNCLYRLYERLVLDDTVGYRNEIEYFWRHAGWPVAEIPDPQDPDRSRYAFMAAIPQLLVRAFNRNIEMGLARYTPAIISPEEAEALRKTPEHAKVYENTPPWSSRVKPVKRTLTVPMVQGPDLVVPDDKELDAAFLKMNIRLGVPHIQFT